MGTRRRIGYVVSLFPCWSETFILNELVELRRRGYDPAVFSIRSDLESLVPERAEPFRDRCYYPGALATLAWGLFFLVTRPVTMGRTLAMIVRGRHPNALSYLKHLWCMAIACRFAAISKREQLDHIHAHFATWPTFVACLLSELTGIPCSFTCHAHDIYLDNPFLDRMAERAAAVVTISEYNRTYLAKRLGKEAVRKVHVIHCGVDMETLPAMPAKRGNDLPVVVGVGRLTEIKGFGVLIDGCTQLAADRKFRCIIVGEGPLREPLTRQIERLGLTDTVTLEGALDHHQVLERVGHADVFVLPSVHSKVEGQDGIPVALMEAMALGVPVVASSLSGIPELVVHNETGLLTEPGNPDEVAAALRRLLDDETLRLRLAQAGRDKVRREFASNITTGQLLTLFDPDAGKGP